MAKSLPEPSDQDEREAWIDEVRRGGSEMLGRALEASRAYLFTVAAQELGADLKTRCSAADLVQETIFKAQRDFAAFRGRDEIGFRRWLVGILRNSVLEQRRYFQAQGRDLKREVSIHAAGPFDGLDRGFQDGSTSPSGKASRREHARLVLRALERLPKREYQVVTWREWEGCTFEEIGRRLDCSHVNARKIYEQAKEDLARQLSRLEDELS
jgi:RNA polymerase sigma-70 factor (ECF subfamily)